MAGIYDLLLGGQTRQPRQPFYADVPASLMQMLQMGMQNRQRRQMPEFNPMPAPQLPQMDMSVPQGESLASLVNIERTKKHDALMAEDREKQKALEEQAIADQALIPGYIEAMPKNLSPQEQANYFMKGPVTLRKWGMDIIENMTKAASNPRNFQLAKVGIPGKPDLEQNVYLDANGQPVPFGEPLRRNSGVSIYTGDQQFMRPATREEKVMWGIRPDIPASANTKTGEVKAIPKDTTEDQGKTIMNLSGVETALRNLERLQKITSTDIVANKKDFIGSVMSNTGIPFVKEIGNSMSSESQQQLEAAKAELITSISHMLSGAGVPETEALRKAKAYVQEWGDKPGAIESKMDSVRNLIESGRVRSGQPSQMSSRPVERSFSKSGKPIFKNAEGKWEYE